MSAVGTDDYADFCAGLREICGLDLGQYKRPQMERRLRSFLGSRGVTRLPDHLEELRRDRTALDALLDRVTINVSQLWRHPEQWRALEHTALPELMDSDPAVGLRAWSAGCSYGAEAYTLAAVCRRVLPGRRVTILGTDIDARMVTRAREGLFTEDDTRDAPPDELVAGFERVPQGWQARAQLRRMTRFERSDLLQILPRRAGFDLILCRNTTIYFADPVRDDLHARLAHALRPGGYLVVGGTERVAQPASLGLEATRPFFYRKS
jgi:chemotaxis protein methyltransferase CheR